MRTNVMAGLVVALLAGWTCSESSAGAWTLGQGQKRLEVWSDHWSNTHTYDGNGDRTRNVNSGKFERAMTAFKYEHSLSDALGTPRGVDLLLSGDFVWFARWTDANATSLTRRYDIGDFRVGAKIGLMEAPVVLSVQSLVKIPGPYDQDEDPEIFTGEFDVEVLRVLAGYPFAVPIMEGADLYRKVSGERPSDIAVKSGALTTGFLAGWVGAEAAYEFRGGPPTNPVKYFAEVGVAVMQNLAVKATLDGIDSASGSGDDVEEDYTKWTLSAIYTASEAGVLADQFRHTGQSLTFELGMAQTAAGKNSGAGEELFFAIAHKW